MLQRRGMYIIVGGLLAATVAAAATVHTLFPGLPDPAEADREGLCRWLVLRDLAEEPPELRRQLVLRLETELDRGIDLAGVESQIDTGRRDRFWHNVEVLSESWLHLESQRYHAVGEDQQRRKIRQTAERINRWKVMEWLAGRPEQAGAEPAGAQEGEDALADDSEAKGTLGHFDAKLQRWVTRTDSPARAQFQQFVTALRRHLVWQAIRERFSPLR